MHKRERTLTLYFEHLEKAEYIKSYQLPATDPDILSVADEGMEDFLSQINE